MTDGEINNPAPGAGENGMAQQTPESSEAKHRHSGLSLDELTAEIAKQKSVLASSQTKRPPALFVFGKYISGAIAVLLVISYVCFVCLDKKYPTPEETEKALAAFVSPYDAVRDWDKAFWAGEVVLPEGRFRAAHTEDIKKALVRTDSRPVLIIGRILDRYSGTQAGGKHFIRIRAQYHQTPILDLWLSCSKEVYKKTPGPLDKIWLFAGIVQANTVMRPISEDETYTFEPGMPAIELYSDTYYVTGECLDILYITVHDFRPVNPSNTFTPSDERPQASSAETRMTATQPAADEAQN